MAINITEKSSAGDILYPRTTTEQVIGIDTYGNKIENVQYKGSNLTITDKVVTVPTEIAVSDTEPTGEEVLWLDTSGDTNIQQDNSTILEDLYSYGVMWDITVADPTLTRIGNPLLHKSLPVQSQYRGCVAKGNVISYYLYPSNWAYKEDGVTPSVLDGTDGDVRVSIPKFYGKYGTVATDSNKRWVKISDKRIDNTWTEIPAMLVDAYRCTINTTDSTNYKTASVVNTTAAYRGGANRSAYDTYLETDPLRSDLGKPRTAVTRSSMRTYATNAGSELLCYEFYKWIFYWAWTIEYATFNSQLAYNADLTSDGYHQGGLGAGFTTINNSINYWSPYNGYYPLVPNGTGNSIGNFTGLISMTYPETVIDSSTTLAAQTISLTRWRGFDNIFGDLWTNLDGVLVQGYTDEDGTTYSYKNLYTTTDSSLYGDTEAAKANMNLVTSKYLHTDGVVKQFAENEIVPTAVGTSYSTYHCDYSYTGSKDASLGWLCVGGNACSGANSGLSCFASGRSPSSAAAAVGFRTLTRL